LGELLDALPAVTGERRRNFCQAVFSLERESAPAQSGGLHFEFHAGEKRRSLFDLMLFAFQTEDDFRLACTHRCAAADSSSVQRWLDHYKTLLGGLMEHPDMAVTRLPVLTPAERRRLLVEFNNPGAPPRPSSDIGALFEEQATLHPDKVAVVFSERSLTYAELNAQANTFAARLLAHGPCQGKMIAVLGERSIELVAGLLGTLKCGAAYVPIDPRYPAERIRFMLEDSGASAALTDRAFASRLPAGMKIIPLECDQEQQPSAAANPGMAVPPEALAYLIYTSGSTGAPKGSPIPHRAVVRLVRNNHFAEMGPDETFLLMSSLSFDASTLELWAPLLNGGTLAILPAGDFSLEGIGEAIQRHGVTSLWLTAGLFQLMVDDNIEALRPLRQLLAGGDVLPPKHVRKVLESLPHVRVINGYGPTESTTFACCHTISPPDLERSTIPIGRPIANTLACIVNASGDLAPVGVPGELLLGGAGLAEGYWNRPDLTAEKFIANKFADEGLPGRTLYRTGDLCRWNDDGTVEFLGRIDSQAKVRGFRVEPGETEAVLAAHPHVRQACAAVRGESAGEKYLAAWIVPEPGACLTARQILDFAAEILTAHQTPSAVAMVDELPLTPNGKVDYRALPDPLRPDGGAPAASVPPATETQRRLAHLWEEVLGRNHFGMEDDFFMLGGTSLSGLRLFTRIRQTFDVSLPLGILFKASTVTQLAKEIDRTRATGKTRTTPLANIQPDGAGLPLFCIHGGDGAALFYANLLRHLPPNRPVFTIEAPALVDERMPVEASAIEDVAAEYIAIMKSVRPKGPYLIGGYSYGGVVAYEMARQLRDCGADVPLLILFDTDNPNATLRQYGLAKRLAVNWRNQKARTLTGRLIGLGERIRSGIEQRLKRDAELAAVRELRKRGIAAEEAQLRQIQIREANVEAMRQYRAGPYSGTVLLLRSEEASDKFELAADYGWSALVEELLIERIPGRHLEIFDEPHVAVLAQKLERNLLRLADTPQAAAAAR
jgi:aspartate racemase